ncbi:MAG: acyl-CoA dehydrogenase C-terminal domain-containing protein [Acidocella sp.]|uniref:acyl-CoA dehydrogenase C-terminal domain-containing protein n=1 Tax=Acidocella sp. TaxID=50710 RepID=UPI003FD80D5D
MSEFIEANQNHPHLGKLVQGFGRAFGALQLATSFIAEKGMTDPEEAGAAATDYLRLFGLVALGFMWARMALIAAEKAPLGGPDAAFYQAKLTTARFYMERILPQAGALLFTIKAGKASLMELADAAF